MEVLKDCQNVWTGLHTSNNYCEGSVTACIAVLYKHQLMYLKAFQSKL